MNAANCLPQIVLEFRGTRVESYSFLDQKSGQKREGVTITHTFEGAQGEVFALRELAATPLSKPEEYKPAPGLKKGTMWVLLLREFSLEKGVGRGVIQSLQPAAVIPAK